MKFKVHSFEKGGITFCDETSVGKLFPPNDVTAEWKTV